MHQVLSSSIQFLESIQINFLMLLIRLKILVLQPDYKDRILNMRSMVMKKLRPLLSLVVLEALTLLL